VQDDGRKNVERHLSRCAGKAGRVFPLTTVSLAFDAATEREDLPAFAFLVTAAEVHDLLGEVARLVPADGACLPRCGSTSLEVPNELVLAARDLVINWDRESD